MKRIVIVDDSQPFLEALQKSLNLLLPNNNVVYLYCLSIRQVEKHLGENQPDVMFLDHNLSEEPGGEGLVLATEYHEKMKIFSTSGDLTPELVTKYQELGIEWLGKNLKNIYKEIKNL